MRYFKAIAVLLFIYGIGCNKDSSPANVGNNSDPVIQAVILTPERVRTGESCIIRCEAVDLENDALRYEWDAGLGSISGSGAEVFYTMSECCESPVIHVTVKDSKGGTITQQIEIPIQYD